MLIGVLGVLLSGYVLPRLEASNLTTVTFSGSSEKILNPERGYVAGWDILNWDPANERSGGRSMVRGFVNLANYRNSPLDATFLNSLNTGLARVRAAHIKTTMRFKYNNGENYPVCPEASKSLMLEHISQLAPILQQYADVIVSQEAGFMGCWGEWSGNSPLKDQTDEADIVSAMLKALPGKPVQVRSPTYKAAIYNAPNPMTVTEAFSGDDRSRVGHYNDCLLSTQDGQGLTYPTDAVSFWMNYVGTETKWLSMGGETCGRTINVPTSQIAASSCTQAGGQAQSRLAQYHVSYLNYQDVVQTDWQNQGCYNEIGTKLGYRLRLNTVAYSSSAASGGTLHLDVGLTNDGYAAVMNPRPVYAVLDGNGARYELPLNVDPRLWSGGATQAISVDVPVPASVLPGIYRLSLWLPDSAPKLKSDPLYAIRFANQGTWDATTGLNIITTDFSVSAAAASTLQAPASVTSATSAAATINSAFTYQITASNGPTSFNAQGLPPGLTVNTSTGLISGTPGVVGTYMVTLTASNPNGSGSAILTLTVSAQPASINLIQSNTVDGAFVGSIATAFPRANTAGNLIIAFVRMSTTSQTVVVNDSAGNVYNKAISQVQSADGHQVYIFFARNIKGLSDTVTATFSSTNNHPWLAVYEYSGLNTVSPLDQTAAAQGYGAIPGTAAITTRSGNELIFAATGLPASFTGATSAGPAYTMVQQNTGTSRAANEVGLDSFAGSAVGTFTLNAPANWTSVLAAFKQ